jgi:hypothetical protein
MTYIQRLYDFLCSIALLHGYIFSVQSLRVIFMTNMEDELQE